VTTISHVVLVSWKGGQQAQAEGSVRPAIRDFVQTIPDVVSVVEGHSSSPEGLENGYDYGFIITFATAQARDAYLTHPNHLPVADAIGRAAARVVVFDI
jgi:stress responsive alpha/beta barrel protein